MSTVTFIGIDQKRDQTLVRDLLGITITAVNRAATVASLLESIGIKAKRRQRVGLIVYLADTPITDHEGMNLMRATGGEAIIILRRQCHDRSLSVHGGLATLHLPYDSDAKPYRYQFADAAETGDWPASLIGA